MHGAMRRRMRHEGTTARDRTERRAMSRTRIAIAALAAALALLLALAAPWSAGSAPPAGRPSPPPPGALPAAAASADLAAAPGAAPLLEPADRTAAPAAGAAPALPAQGLRGRVVAANGAAAAGVRLAALPAPAWSPMALAQPLAQGVAPAPFRETRSDGDGRFELALPAAAVGVPIELWTVADNGSDADAVTHHAGLGDGEWRELGDVRLAPAFPVDGRVVDQSGQPIAEATITVWAADADPGSLPAIGERRIRSDGDGRFRIAHLGKGVFGVAAMAPGYARWERERQHVFDDQPNELLVTLAPGGAVAGVVVDRDGAPIPHAFVAGDAEDPSNLARPSARCDATGRFLLAGLDRGAWTVRASAPTHQTAVVHGVAAGMHGLRLALAPHGSVRLRVTDAAGTPLRRYTVTARPPRHHADAGLRALAPRPIGPDDVRDGACMLPGFDDGAWQLEVQAPEQALAFSDVVDVQAGRVTEVTVVVRAGGALAGVARDAAGAPLVGAAVQTQPDGFGDGELGAVFRGLQVWEVTSAAVVTDAAGRFAMAHLAPGAYQLRITPVDGMPSFVRGLLVREGETTAAPELRLARGCAVAGSARHDDEAAAEADVSVQIMAIDVPDLPAGYTIEAAVDAHGRFRLPMRLRPGHYVAMAGRRLRDNPFQEDADREASRREFRIDDALPELALTLRFPR